MGGREGWGGGKSGSEDKSEQRKVERVSQLRLSENCGRMRSSQTKNGGGGGTVCSESFLRSPGAFLSWVRAPPPALWPH
ncbi:hypothetical protein PoB_003095700 [Plakobranchus ocellatus]|uniref:Uncharacterized protein n=1 Tax=Plakobranchus ocellatus TaxID=259542 RepID=A0AAV4AC34_9GAST|nr:hypothetical protein PoB_003095700 [Plakobranchus ocellatus]